METRFTWDPKKALKNLRKHGVSFESAIEVFSDPNHIETPNYFVDGEQRSQLIGMTEKLVLLLVVFVDRSTEGVEIIHIISARKGESIEEQIYEEQIS
jgi:hypothetical protein